MKLIRPAHKADIPAVLQIENSSFSQPWSERSLMSELQNPESYFTVCVNDDIVAGFLILRAFGCESEIFNVAVSAEFRRNGIGALLVEDAIAYARVNALLPAFLEVRASNIAAQALYAKYGFKPLGRRKNYYTAPLEDAIIMKREED